MNLMGLLRRRSSAHAFAENAISDAELRHLAQAASLAPSAFLLQNGRFTAVCSPEAKQALCEAAFRQPKILQAAAVFIISGDLLGYQALAERLQPVVAAGQMDQATADGWAAFAQSAFHEQPQAQRDEAMRSASLAAMALMLAAAEAGWASCPMSGFDPRRRAQAGEFVGKPSARAAGGRGQSSDPGAESARAGRAAMAADLSRWK